MLKNQVFNLLKIQNYLLGIAKIIDNKFMDHLLSYQANFYFLTFIKDFRCALSFFCIFIFLQKTLIRAKLIMVQFVLNFALISLINLISLNLMNNLKIFSLNLMDNLKIFTYIQLTWFDSSLFHSLLLIFYVGI